MNRFVGAVVLCALCSVLSIRTARGDDLVRLGNLKFAHYGAVLYMKELAPKYRLKIEEQVFAKGIDIMPAISAGAIDAAASAADAAISARAKGVDIYIVAGFARGGVRLIGRADLPINSVADLKGKKVGVARGGAQELALLAELSKFNLTYSDQPGKDVQLVYLAYGDLNQALMMKHLDAISQSEPQASQAISMGFGKEILKPYDTSMGMPVRVLFMTEKMYRERRDVAERFVKCFVEATKLFLEKPQVAQKYTREVVFKGQLSEADYHAAMENSPLTYDISLDHVDTTSQMMVKFGVGRMQNPPAARDYVKLDLLAKAKQELGVR